MSIITFLQNLYSKYISVKPDTAEPVTAQSTPAAPRVRTTHVTTTTTTNIAPTAPAVGAPPATPPKTTNTGKAAAKTTHPPPADTNKPVAGTTVTDTIYPVMKVAAGDDSAEEHGLVSRKWLGDLVICYAFDTPQGLQLLHWKDIPVGMTAEKLHEVAVENLGRNIEYSLKETSFGGYELVAGGRYESSAVCLPGIWQWLTEQFVDSLLVVIPAKDLVLVIPEQDNHGMNNLQATVRQAFTNSSKSLTGNVFRFNRYSQQWSIIGNAQ